jgi:hypothetical protein
MNLNQSLYTNEKTKMHQLTTYKKRILLKISRTNTLI